MKKAEDVTFGIGENIPGFGAGLADVCGGSAQRQQPFPFGLVVTVGGVDVDVQPDAFGTRCKIRAQHHDGLQAAEAGGRPDLCTAVVVARQFDVVESLTPECGEPFGIGAFDDQFADTACHVHRRYSPLAGSGDRFSSSGADGDVPVKVSVAALRAAVDLASNNGMRPDFTYTGCRVRSSSAPYGPLAAFFAGHTPGSSVCRRRLYVGSRATVISGGGVGGGVSHQLLGCRQVDARVQEVTYEGAAHVMWRVVADVGVSAASGEDVGDRLTGHVRGNTVTDSGTPGFTQRTKQCSGLPSAS